MSSQHVASQPISYTHSLRIELSVEGGKATVVQVHRVAMRAPASSQGSPAERQSGLWVEIRNDDGRILYYRPLRTLHQDSVEVFEDERGGAIRRVPTARPQAMKFDLIVPDLPEAAELRLYGAEDPSATDRPSASLLRSPIQELRLKAAPPR